MTFEAHWTSEESDKLVGLYLIGTTIRDIAETLDRSVSSIYNQLFRLRLSKPEELKSTQSSSGGTILRPNAWTMIHRKAF